MICSTAAITEAIEPPSGTPAQPAQREANINVSLVIDEQSIILIESLDDMNTNGAIFNVSLQKQKTFNTHKEPFSSYCCYYYCFYLILRLEFLLFLFYFLCSCCYCCCRRRRIG
uniref:Uncharacterized protein n=1 Tax=Glossina austeni TaxID=7395 RepID=A0A1A9UCS3_GLOAU